MWILTSITSYIAAVQVTVATEQYLYGGLLGGTILLLGMMAIMIWSKTPTKLLVMLLVPVFGGTASYVILLDPKFIGLLYTVWQSVISVVIVLSIKSIDDTKNQTQDLKI